MANTYLSHYYYLPLINMFYNIPLLGYSKYINIGIVVFFHFSDIELYSSPTAEVSFFFFLL